MANVAAGNPYIFDTATDTAILAAGTIFHCFGIAWCSGSLADTVSLQDAGGVVKWSASGTIANNVDRQPFTDENPLIFNGMKIPTLGSGKLYVYGRRKN